MTDELKAISTTKTFNDLARRAASKGSEMLALIWEAGKVAKAAKKSLPHGEWMPFVERYYDVDHRSVTRWIQFHEAVPESKLDTVSNLTAGIKMLDPPEKRKISAEQEPSSDQGKPGGNSSLSLDVTSASDVPDSSEATAETGEPGGVCEASLALSPSSDDPVASGDSPAETDSEAEAEAPQDGAGVSLKQFPRSHWFKQWEQAIGPVVRLVDKVAREIGESKCSSHVAVQNQLNNATEEMAGWLND